MNQLALNLSPSEAYSRLNELLSQAEYEKLSTDEIKELKFLKELCSDALSDFQEDYY